MASAFVPSAETNNSNGLVCYGIMPQSVHYSVALSILCYSKSAKGSGEKFFCAMLFRCRLGDRKGTSNNKRLVFGRPMAVLFLGNFHNYASRIEA